MSNDQNVKILQYNTKLADVVSDISSSEIINARIFVEAKELAEKTHNTILLKQLEVFKQNFLILQKQKEEALLQAAKSKERAELAEKIAQKEQDIRKQKEKELEAQKQKNLY